MRAVVWCNYLVAATPRLWQRHVVSVCNENGQASFGRNDRIALVIAGWWWCNDNEVRVTTAARRGQVYELHLTTAAAPTSVATNTAFYCHDFQLLVPDVFQSLRHSAATAVYSASTEPACVFQDQSFQDQELSFDACHWLELDARPDEHVFFFMLAALIIRLSVASARRLPMLWV